MSKNRNYKSYNNYSNPKTEEVAAVEETPVVTEAAVEEVSKTEEIPVEEIIEEAAPVVTEEVKEEVKQVIGGLVDCARLRVRKAPNTTADVLCEIDSTAKVMIDKVKSTSDFYKVCTEAGVEGYCMKKFIKIES